MTHTTYFQNFFVALCASLSDDEFLAFAETVRANLERDAAAHQADLGYLVPLIDGLRTAHQQRGPLGKSGTTATLAQTVRNFLTWAKVTNTTHVFPAFPDPKQAERIDIFPGGMEALYQAKQGNILERARYYLDRIGTTYTAQTKVMAKDAQAQYDLLEAALTKRRTHTADTKEGSAAVDAEEAAVCRGLYRAYAGLLYQYFDDPARAYAYFPFPRRKGEAADDNLPQLPAAPHPAG